MVKYVSLSVYYHFLYQSIHRWIFGFVSNAGLQLEPPFHDEDGNEKGIFQGLGELLQPTRCLECQREGLRSCEIWTWGMSACLCWESKVCLRPCCPLTETKGSQGHTLTWAQQKQNYGGE